ncbi:MAG: hypothetical protein HY293_16290 [Planctomycetes bacterium]|nr:hypothetical protein [Planctomycetota bacterium]
MRKLLLAGGIGAFVVAALTYPVAGLIANNAVEAWVIVAKDPGSIAVEREIFEPPKGVSKESPAYRDAVMRIYGVPTDEPIKVIFVPKEKFIHPAELPSMTLLPKETNYNPTQLKSVYFIAPRAVIGASATGALLLVISLFLGKKAGSAPKQPAA